MAIWQVKVVVLENLCVYFSDLFAARFKRSIIADPIPDTGIGFMPIELDFVIFAKWSKSARALYKFIAASSGSEISDKLSPFTPTGKGPKASSNSLPLGVKTFKRIGVSGQ